MINDPVPGAEGTSNDSMSAKERQVWAASKGLPNNYLILTVEEMMTMRDSMRQQQAQASDLAARFKKCIAVLGTYWATEPDLVNAIGAAVFDADRYKKACEVSAPKIQKLKDKLDAAIKLAGTTIQPVVFADFVEVSADLGNEFAFIVEQMAKRRERKK